MGDHFVFSHQHHPVPHKLHREAVFILDRWAADEFDKKYDELYERAMRLYNDLLFDGENFFFLDDIVYGTMTKDASPAIVASVAVSRVLLSVLGLGTLLATQQGSGAEPRRRSRTVAPTIASSAAICSDTADCT